MNNVVRCASLSRECVFARECMCLCCDNREQKLRAVLASMTCSMMNMWSLNHRQPIYHSFTYRLHSIFLHVYTSSSTKSHTFITTIEICFNLSFSIYDSFNIYIYISLCAAHVYVCVFDFRMCTQNTHKYTTKSSINDLYCENTLGFYTLEMMWSFDSIAL